ncbi:Map3k1 [Scenedesmus sp. PABB004]|nr:Map3k1 [Scenedesmus sp. PABB004]
MGPRRKRAAAAHADSDGGGAAAQPEPRKRRRRAPAAAARSDDDTDYEAAASASEAAASKAARRGGGKGGAAAGEKRTDAWGSAVRYAPMPSQAVLERIARAQPGSGHRMFLLGTSELRPAGAPGGRAQQFSVLGATANVYEVTIGCHPHCSCPDFPRSRLCKHVLFVLLRVLRVAPHDPIVWQKALLAREAEALLGGQHSQGADLTGVLADARTLQAFRRATGAAGGEDEEQEQQQQGVARRPVEGDCPICFEELQDGGEPLEWCATCGNSLHAACFSRWADTKRRGHATVTCCFCRAPWAGTGPGSGGAAAAGLRDGYINLTTASAAHAGADTGLDALYGERARWIRRHQGGPGS